MAQVVVVIPLSGSVNPVQVTATEEFGALLL